MTERDFYPKFKEYILSHKIEGTETYELKFINYQKCKSFAFNRVESHQVLNLMTSLDGLYLRIADQPYINNGFQQKKPFDSTFIMAKNAYIVIVFWNPRKWTKGFMMPVQDLPILQSMERKKSISFEKLSSIYQTIEF